MKVAIIGANGFIGTRLVEQFHLNGWHEVFPVVRKPSSLALPARFQVPWRVGDALKTDSLTKALEGCEAVVHAAIGDPLQIEQMPAVLCAAASAAGIKRVVYLSSASVHGQNIPANTSETSQLHTNHSLDYNNAKVRAEHLFFTEASRHGLAAYALRPGVVFGPRSRWIADLAQELRSGRAWLFDEGRGVCNSIYVDNLVHAIRLCLEAESGAGQAYLVGDRETVLWADFYRAAADALGVPFETVHRVSELPTFTKSWRERVEKTVAQPWAQALLPAFPYVLKRTTKTVMAALNTPPPADSWTLPDAPKPAITEEMAALQQNRWKLPYDKAESVLGYRAPVTFSEGMRRSLAWLRFATELGSSS